MEEKGLPIYEEPLIGVNSNGSVGDTFLRTEEKYAVHDDVTLIKVKKSRIHLPYMIYALREAIAKAQFRYDAKLYLKRLKPLKIRIPMDENGMPDYDIQEVLATRHDRLVELKKSVLDFAKELEGKVITY